AANTDPEVLPDGGRPVTGNRAHMAFGAGPHTCPAREQARLITRTAVTVLRERLPDMRLAVPEDRLVWASSPWTRGLAALPVRFTAPHAARHTAARPAPGAGRTATGSCTGFSADSSQPRNHPAIPRSASSSGTETQGSSPFFKPVDE
ncbi:hypothetical protein ACSNOF_26740, partial [Streptomyces sp. URMC 125]